MGEPTRADVAAGSAGTVLSSRVTRAARQPSAGDVCLDACERMLKDLELERTAVAAKGRSYVVDQVSAVKGEPPYHHYKLRLREKSPMLKQESCVLLEVTGGSRVTAEVLSASGRVVCVASLKPLPVRTPGTTPQVTALVVDDSWLTERLQSRLREVRAELGARPLAFNRELAALALDPRLEQLETPVPFSKAREAALSGRLNLEQLEAVKASLEQRLLVLWGPPGTGKSTTLAAMIQVQVEAGRRVLVLAPSNAAADVLASKVAEQLQEHDRFQRGLVIRVGPRPTGDLMDRWGTQLVPHKIAQRIRDEAFEPLLSSLGREIDASLDPGASANRVEKERALLVEAADRFGARVYDDVLDHCQVAVAPAAQLHLSGAAAIRGRWDAVVVDEASMMTLPYVWLAAGSAAEQLIIAGDFRQLPAPVQHAPRGDVPTLSRDVFEWAGIPRAVERDDPPKFMRTLCEQYRMVKPINDVVSGLFYGDRLRVAGGRPMPSAAKWGAHQQIGALALVDTTAQAPRVAFEKDSGSRRNDVHTDVVARLVESLCAGGTATSPAPGSMLILSCYNAQVRALHEKLAVRRKGSRELVVSTVHKAQGGEADTVILCLDDAFGADPSSWMTASRLTDEGARLLAVAASRAKSRLIVVACATFLNEKGGHVVQAFLETVGDGRTIKSLDV